MRQLDGTVCFVRSEGVLCMVLSVGGAPVKSTLLAQGAVCKALRLIRVAIN